MSLHVRISSEAIAAGLRKPQQVHGPFLQVGSAATPTFKTEKDASFSFQMFVFSLFLSEFKRDFLELLRRRFGEFQFKGLEKGRYLFKLVF